MSERIVEGNGGAKTVTQQGYSLETKRLAQCIDVIGLLGYRSHSVRFLTQHVGAAIEKDELRVAAKVVEHRMEVFVRESCTAVHNDYNIIAATLSFVYQSETIRFKSAVLETRRPDVMIGQKG